MEYKPDKLIILWYCCFLASSPSSSVPTLSVESVRSWQIFQWQVNCHTTDFNKYKTISFVFLLTTSNTSNKQLVALTMVTVKAGFYLLYSSQNHDLSAQKIHQIASGEYIEVRRWNLSAVCDLLCLIFQLIVWLA